jgi:protein-S-isoprenylcysteine O-methyltransferase Ste14
MSHDISPTSDNDDDELDPGSIIAPSPVLLLFTFLAGIVLDRVKRIEGISRPWNVVIGGCSFVVGTVLFVSALRTMRSSDTGPSHDDDPPELITWGVFEYSRNPIYVGNCLQYVGVSLLYNSLWPLVLLVPVVAYLDRIIDQEEAYLEVRFDGEFESYRENVRRWV